MKLPLLYRFNRNNLRVSRSSRLTNYNTHFINLLRSRFKFEQFSYECNYKFFKLAYEIGTLAVYKPRNNINVNLYDSLIVFKYHINDSTKTKNNLPPYVEADDEDIRNSGGLLPSGPLEVGKDVILFWTHSTSHISDIQRLNDVYIKQLVNLDEIIDISCNSLRMPYIITGKQRDDKNTIDKYLEESFNNNSVLYIDEKAANKLSIKQPVLQADNYLTALQNQRNSVYDEALGSIGFVNLGRGETHQKERLLTAEIKVESDVTNEILYDYIHCLQQFARWFEDVYAKELTPLISINGAYVDLETGLKYFKVKGAGAPSENNTGSLSDILLNYNKESGNTTTFGRSSGSNPSDSTKSEDQNTQYYGPDNEERRNGETWTHEIDRGKMEQIPYNQPSYLDHLSSSIFQSVVNFFRSGLNLYRINENSIMSNNIFDFSNWVASRNSISLTNKYDHFFDELISEKPITKQKISDVVFDRKEYKSSLRYYLALLNVYTRLGFIYSFPSILISFLVFSAYYNNPVAQNFDEFIGLVDPEEVHAQNLQLIEAYKQNELANREYEFQKEYKKSSSIGGAILKAFHIIGTPLAKANASLKSRFKAVNVFNYLISFKWINKMAKYMFLYIVRSFLYSFAYNVSYNLITFLNNKIGFEDNPVYAHYITVFNAALITGYLADSKDYKTGLKYAASMTLSHHLQTLLLFTQRLTRNEKNVMINFLLRLNDHILIQFPKDLISYGIASLIVDKIIDAILDPKEGLPKRLIKLGFKGIYKLLKGVSVFSAKSFYILLQKIFHMNLPPMNEYLENIHKFFSESLYNQFINIGTGVNNFVTGAKTLAHEFSQDMGRTTRKVIDKSIEFTGKSIDTSSEFLYVHFDAMLNMMTRITKQFYNVLYDFYQYRYHPKNIVDNFKKQVEQLDESDNIINQNPIDLENERNDQEIKQRVIPKVDKFVSEVIEGESYDVAARNIVNQIEEEEYKKFDNELEQMKKDNDYNLKNTSPEFQNTINIIENTEVKNIDDLNNLMEKFEEKPPEQEKPIKLSPEQEKNVQRDIKMVNNIHDRMRDNILLHYNSIFKKHNRENISYEDKKTSTEFR